MRLIINTLFVGAILFASISQLQAAIVNGTVWNDLNNNGLREKNEPCLANVWVTLETFYGAKISGEYTDSNGQYRFEDVPDMRYRVSAAPPGNGLFPAQIPKGKPKNESNRLLNIGLSDVFVAKGSETLTLDLGFTSFGKCATPLRVFVDSVWCDPESEQYLFSYEVYGGTAIGCISQGWVSDDLQVGRSAYGQKKIAGPFAATTGTEEFEVFDHDNPACKKRLSVKIPECGEEKDENLENAASSDDRNKANPNGQTTDEDFVCPTDFAVYPNPTKDLAWADVPDFGGNPVEIRVMDAAGREVFRQNLGKTSGETVSLPVGNSAGNVFFVQVYSGSCVLGQRLEVSR